MEEAVKYLARVLVIVFLTSCSGEYHLRQAYKKGMIVNDTNTITNTDTLIQVDTVFDFLEIPYEKIVVKDSIWCDSNNLPQSKLGKIQRKGNRASITAELDTNGIYTLKAECDSLEVAYESQISKTSVVTNKLTNQIKINEKLAQKLKEKETYLTHWIITLVLLGGCIFAYIKK